MAFHVKIVVFLVASIGLAWVSWPSLRHIRSHGFYRFFAWEAILVLILLNIDHWFTKPFSNHQLVSWFLLIVSLYLVVHGVLLLHKIGKPDRDRRDTALIGIEKTTALVTVGIYRFIRHPLYASLLFLAWGAFFKQPSLTGISLAAAATLFLALTAKMEEVENLRYFGAAYREYMHRSRMFIPFLF